MLEDQVRVLRIYEFTGPRSVVEKQIANSIQGERKPGNGVTIRAATLGTYPEVIGVTMSKVKRAWWERVLGSIDRIIFQMNQRSKSYGT